MIILQELIPGLPACQAAGLEYALNLYRLHSVQLRTPYCSSTSYIASLKANRNVRFGAALCYVMRFGACTSQPSLTPAGATDAWVR